MSNSNQVNFCRRDWTHYLHFAFHNLLFIFYSHKDKNILALYTGQGQELKKEKGKMPKKVTIAGDL